MEHNHQNQMFSNNLIKNGNGYYVTLPSVHQPYNIHQIPIIVAPSIFGRPMLSMENMVQDNVSINTHSQLNSSTSSNEIISVQDRNTNSRQRNSQPKEISSTNRHVSLTEAQRKQKETNLRIYTRLFVMMKLTECGYEFKVKNKRHQVGKKVLYSISKIISSDSQEELVNRMKREEYARETIPKVLSDDKYKKQIEKFVDECIDNLLIELLEMCGFNVNSKMSSMFRAVENNEELLKFKKYTLTHIDVVENNEVRRLTREMIFDEYKETLDKFAETLRSD